MADKTNSMRGGWPRIVGLDKLGLWRKGVHRDVTLIEVKDDVSFPWVRIVDARDDAVDRDLLKHAGIEILPGKQISDIQISGGTIVRSAEGWGIELTREGAARGRKLGDASLRRVAGRSKRVKPQPN